MAKNYFCAVDSGREVDCSKRLLTFRVGAKSEIEAMEFVQKTVGFGTIVGFCEDIDHKVCKESDCGRVQRVTVPMS